LSSSMFNNDGDAVALFSPDGVLIDQYSYPKDPGIDISIGRTPDQLGGFQVLASVTKGSPNSPPQPTVTPTPAPTEKPTKEPKPTETPKPVKNQTLPTTIPPLKNANSQSVLADSTVYSSTRNVVAPTRTASNDSQPTSILIKKTSSSSKERFPQKRILVKGVTSSTPQMVAIISGGILFLSCGILMYLKKKEIWVFGKNKE